MALMSAFTSVSSTPDPASLGSETNSPPGEGVLTQALPTGGNGRNQTSVGNFRWGQAESLLCVYQNIRYFQL